MAVFVVTACLWDFLSPKHKIKKKYKDWIPYVEDEKLIFQNQFNEVCTIKITGISTNSSSDNDPLAAFIKYDQTVTINALMPRVKGDNGRFSRKTTHANGRMFKMSASKKKVHLRFWFYMLDYGFSSTQKYFDLTASSRCRTFQTNLQTYTDTQSFKLTNTSFLPKPSGFIEEIIWSDHYGLVFFKTGKQEWSLLSKEALCFSPTAIDTSLRSKS